MKINSIIDLVKDLDTSRQTKNLNKLLIRILLHLQVEFSKDKKVICKITDYVPNGLIPEADDCGDYIRLRIKHDGMIENWMEKPDFSDFIKDADAVKKIDTSIEEEPILDTKVEFTYSHLMAKLLRLPKYLQLEIGKALIANASEGFEEEDDEDSL